MGVVDFLVVIEPVALRERVRAAVYDAFSEVIATEPKLAPAAHLHRGLVFLAGGNEDAAVHDFRVAVASQDGPVVYQAATQLLQLGKTLAPQEWAETPWLHAYEVARDRAGIGFHGGHKSHYTAEISAWRRASATLLFTAHPAAILAWLHRRPGHTLALPALDRFYAVAADFGYANPMPEVRQLLGIAHGASMPPQRRTDQIT